MSVYFYTMFMVLIFGTLEYQKRVQLVYIYNAVGRKKINVYLVIIVAIFCFAGGFRYLVGTDYWAYVSIKASPFDYLMLRFIKLDEPLLFLLVNICRSIWDEGIFVIFVIHAITVIFVIKGIMDYEENSSYVMPLLLYILYCGWTGSFNAVRQSLAAAVIFAFSRKSESKWWILKYSIVCFIAFLIHKSAIFILPILLIANRRIDFKQFMLLTVVSFLLPFAAERALYSMGKTLESGYASHGVNSIRILVSGIPLVFLFFLSRRKLTENSFIINMAIINFIITFGTRNSALLYRFSDFTVMYLMIYIPMCMNLFSKQAKKIIKLLILFLYAIYFYIEVQSGNGNLNNFQWAFGHFGEY